MLDAASARRRLMSPPSPASSRSTATTFSKNWEAMPVAPTLPISSLSTSTVMAVRTGVSSRSSWALSDGYAQAESSWPYPMNIERSKPSSRAGPAGTTSISAERKSSSSMPYFLASSWRTNAFTGSFAASFSRSLLSASSFFLSASLSTIGRLPTSTSRSSAATTSEAVFFIWSFARWMSRSETQNTGSSASSPTFTCTTEPSFLATTPCSARGNVTHWSCLTPP